MGRFWSLLFFLVPVLGVATFIWAVPAGIWLPPDVSEHGHTIDYLFLFILFLTGIVFIGTELVLAWFVWKYRTRPDQAPAKYTHGNHHLEVVWTVIPAAILLFIALFQMNAWTVAKMAQPDVPPMAEVTARQFEWRIRYPGADGKLGTRDDIFDVNDLHVPLDEEILIELKSQDVLHDFFLPNLRIKQDAVPGMMIPVWFRPTEIGNYELVCAELCGWGHYKMKGRLTVESRSDFEHYLESKRQEQEATR